MNLESANLILRTSNASVNTNGHTITWNSINLKDVMGSMYEKYSKFKICLTSFANTNTGLTGVTNGDRCLSIFVNGLDFINSGYDSGSFNYSQTWVGCCTVTTNAVSNFNFTGEIGQTFLINKSNYTTNITIQLKRIDNAAITTTVNYGSSVFCFTIYGIN